jgi:hypothetical protein
MLVGFTASSRTLRHALLFIYKLVTTHLSKRPKLNQEIKISRSNLIEKCDQYLNGEIQEKDFEDYAWNLITDEHFDWNDDVFSILIYGTCILTDKKKFVLV